MLNVMLAFSILSSCTLMFVRPEIAVQLAGVAFGSLVTLLLFERKRRTRKRS